MGIRKGKSYDIKKINKCVAQKKKKKRKMKKRDLCFIQTTKSYKVLQRFYNVSNSYELQKTLLN